MRFFLTIGYIFVSTIAVASDLSIALHGTATVAERYIHLREISTIVTADKRLQEALGTLRIGASPKAGYPKQLTRAEVIAIVNSEHPSLVGQVAWSGADATLVKLHAVRHDAAQIKGIARDYLTTVLQQKFADVKIDMIGEIRDVWTPAGNIRYTPRPITQSDIAQRTRVWVDVSLDGDPYSVVPVWFSVAALVPALVAKRNMERGSPVVLADYIQVQRKLMALPAGEQYLAANDFFDGQQLMRPIQAGEILRTSSVGVMPSVVLNQEVSVIAHSGTIRIESRGVALTDGYRGQYVRVRNPRSSQVFRAKVMDDGIVAIYAR